MTGGAERLVIDICNELKKRQKIEVKLLVLSSKNDFKQESISFDISQISYKLNLSILSENLAEIKDFQKAINDFKPDIIHSHLFEAELLSRWNFSSNIKYITHCHDNMSQFSGLSMKKSLKKNLTDLYEKNIIFRKYKKCNNHFITISKNTQDYFLKIVPSLLKKNVTLLPNAINYNKFYNETRFLSKKDKIIKAVCVGSLVDKKNQRFLIPISKHLLSKGYDCIFHVLGDGPNRNSLLNQIALENLNSNIILHGNVDDVEEHMKKADFYIHTAKYEPFGLVLIEAMASKLPVVSLDGKGNKDFIKNGVNGFIFEREDPNIFADKLIELFNDNELYNKISEDGQNTAKNYDIKNYVDKLIKIYKESISSKN